MEILLQSTVVTCEVMTFIVTYSTTCYLTNNNNNYNQYITKSKIIM